MEDQPKLANLLRKGLTAQGLAADIASDGDEATWMATATAYDAITLDVMLPNTLTAMTSPLAFGGRETMAVPGILAARSTPSLT